MKFFLQHARTAQFMRCDSTWSAEISEAFDFLSERAATFFALKEMVDSFRVVKVGAETLLPLLVAQVSLARSPGARLAGPVRVAGHPWEQILPLPGGVRVAG